MNLGYCLEAPQDDPEVEDPWQVLAQEGKTSFLGAVEQVIHVQSVGEKEDFQVQGPPLIDKLRRKLWLAEDSLKKRLFFSGSPSFIQGALSLFPSFVFVAPS